MKEVILGSKREGNMQGIAFVDDVDYEAISQLSWFLDKGYVSGKILLGRGKNKKVYLHRFLLGARKGQMVDHKNGNPLDNRRENLRFCDDLGNVRNKAIQKNNLSGYKGISQKKYKKRPWVKWSASIGVNRKVIYLGSFLERIEAAHAYDEAAKHYFGEFARLNFPANS